MSNSTTWLPSIIALPFLDGYTLRRNMRLHRHPVHVTRRAYPPSFMLVTVMLPWIRVFYLTVKRNLFRFFLSRKPHRSNPSAMARAESHQTTQVVFVPDFTRPNEGQFDDVDNMTDTYTTLDDGTMVRNQAMDPEHGIYLEDMELVDPEAGIPRTIYVSFFTLTKLVVQALAFPFIANLAGSLLAVGAKRSWWLKAALGIPFFVAPATDFGFWKRLFTVPEREAWLLQLPFFEQSALPSFTGTLPDELDPVWYRNLIGGGVYIILKDCLVLMYRYLRKSQRASVHVKDLPFSDGVARELSESRAMRVEP